MEQSSNPTAYNKYNLNFEITPCYNNKHIYDSSGVQPSKRSAVAKLIQPKTTSFELPT